MKMNREAYEKLLTEDLAWLLKQQHSLERLHIEEVLRHSAEREYGPEGNTPDDASPFGLVQRLRKEAEKWSGTACRSEEQFFMRDLIREAARMIEQRVVAATPATTQRPEERAPAGWKLVPTVPDVVMMAAAQQADGQFKRSITSDRLAMIWRHMLEMAPSAPSPRGRTMADCIAEQIDNGAPGDSQANR